MKKKNLSIIACIICISLSLVSKAQSPIGAWERSYTSDQGEQLKSVVIFSDGYQVLTTYHPQTGKFVHSNGGTWKLVGNTITEKAEFNSDRPDSVGIELSFDVEITDSTLSIVGSDVQLKKIDNGAPGALHGAWLMSGRVKNGKTQLRDTAKPRKTMKILSGTRFQWIAYNTETKEFKGTGGGTYTTINGEYTENIEFFSKDDSRVGASLQFQYELVDGKWNHSGFSSKGDPLNETWSVRE
jgi:hypothetical protein